MLRFEDLMTHQRAGLRALSNQLLQNAADQAETRFDAENTRRGMEGKSLLENRVLATLTRFWPSPLADVSNADSSEQLIGADGGTYILEKGVPIEYMRTWVQWASARVMMGALSEFGITPDNHAAALIELGFHFTYGVAAAAITTEGSDARLLVGIRGGDLVNHSGRLSVPAGLVEPGQTLAVATAAQLIKEVPGLVELGGHELSGQAWDIERRPRKRVGFGAHDRAPSSTFCLEVPIELDDLEDEVIRASHEWLERKLIAVPLDEVLAAIDGNLEAIRIRFARHGLTITEGFAPDVRGPLEVIVTEHQARRDLHSR